MNVGDRSVHGRSDRPRTPTDDEITRRMIRWFQGCARDLPWRQTKQCDGYAALVSESMLQQTQVSRVVESYAAFLQRFPNVHALAAADSQEVLAAWNGLGYYRRATALHAAARMIVNEFDGDVPQTVDALRSLPGVGRYTAGAIASIVFGQREPIVDGNVRRVLSRWKGRVQSDKEAWSRAQRLVAQAAKPGAFNESMMELGATICTPRNPRCGQCPAARWCSSCHRDTRSPRARPRIQAPKRPAHHHAVVIVRGGKFLLEQRGKQGMWAGMWQVPTVERDRPLPTGDLAKRLQARIDRLSKCGQFRHNTTHRDITFHVFAAVTSSRAGIWRSFEEIAQLPMSNAQRRVLALHREMKHRGL